MGDSLFNIFGDVVTRQANKNVSRHQFSSNENMGKTLLSGPYKPKEPSQPMKKIEGNTKRSFLSNTGKAFQSTPVRQTFTPGMKVGSHIYSDDSDTVKGIPSFAEIEFTKPSYKYDNYHTDMFDYLPLPELQIAPTMTPPNTPPPAITIKPNMEFDCSYHDEFYTDDFSIDSLPEADLNLPDIF